MVRREVTALLLMLSLGASAAVGQIQLGGFVEYDNITYWKNGDRQKVNGRNQGIFQLELRHQANAMAEVFGAIEVRNDQADPSRNRLFVDEAYINLYIGDFDVRVGKQIYAWGRADAFNPTDNLTSWDYSDILDTDDEKIGVLSARVDYYVGQWTLEGVVVPSFTASVLPDTDSRWWPDLPAGIPNPAYPSEGSPTLHATYQYVPAARPDEGVKSTQYAVRAYGSIDGWDLGISWYDGFDDLPAVHQDTTVLAGFTEAEVTMAPTYHRRRAIGMDLATNFGAFGIRSEAAYYLTEDWDGNDPAIDDPYFLYTIGVDRSFLNALAGNDLYVLVEWIHEVKVPARNTKYGTTDLNHVLRKSVVGKADLSIGDYKKVTLEGVLNLDNRDWWIRPGLSWSVTDGVQLLAELDLLGGPRDSFFGAFRDNGRLHVRMKYSF